MRAASWMKHFLCKIGDSPSGFLNINSEVDYIKNQIDNGRITTISVDGPNFSFYTSHAVVAVDYNETGNELKLILYGPNHGYPQELILNKQEGIYLLSTQELDGFSVNKMRAKVHEYDHDIYEFFNEKLSEILNGFYNFFARARTW